MEGWIYVRTPGSDDVGARLGLANPKYLDS